MSLNGAAVAIVTGLIGIARRRLKPFDGPDDTAKQHHEACNIQHVTDSADILGEAPGFSAAVFKESDEGEETSFDDSL